MKKAPIGRFLLRVLFRGEGDISLQKALDAAFGKDKDPFGTLF